MLKYDCSFASLHGNLTFKRSQTNDHTKDQHYETGALLTQAPENSTYSILPITINPCDKEINNRITFMHFLEKLLIQ